jgi:hypothetical protein
MKQQYFLSGLSIFICFLYGCRVDNTQKVYDTITVSKERHSFIFMLADQGNYFSDDAQDTVFNKALAGTMSGVNSTKLEGMVLFPNNFFDTTLFTPTAESFLHLFDKYGDNSFSGYPSLFEGMNNHKTNYNSWKFSIDSTQKTSPVCGIGLAKQEFGANINIYAKVDFYESVNDSVNLAIYLIEKKVTGMQRISPTETSYSYVHQHVFLSAANNNDFGNNLAAASYSGASYNSSVSFTLPSNIDKSNIEYLAVVYQYHNDKPIKVLNCTSLK